MLLLLAPSISALVIGMEYDSDSVCDNRDYVIDIKNFLIVAGGVYIGWTLLFCLFLIIGYFVCVTMDEHEFEMMIASLFACPLLIWSFIWAILGLCIYDQNMSIQCQQQPIGQMILAWSIIQISFITLGCCCMICPVCWIY